MRRIVVLGSGLASIRATSALETQLEGRRHIELSLVSESTHFVYRPLLPHVVSGALETTSLSVPLKAVCQSSTDVVVDRIRHIDPDDRVIAGEERDIPFDYLIIAPGAVADWGDHPDWRTVADPFQTIGDAADIRQSLAEAGRGPNRPAMTGETDAESTERLVVIGAGPNGVELASELRSAVDRGTAAESPRPEIVLVDRADVPLPDLPKPFRDACRDHLHDIGVRFVGGSEVVDCREDGVTLEGGESIRAASRLETSVFWCGGTRPPEYVTDDFAVDDAGRVRTDEFLGVNDHYGIYAAGSVAAPPELPPTSAGATARQGETAAGNLLADLSGRTPSRLRIDEPSWPLSLGPDAAAVYRNGTVVAGAAGWALYRLIHTSLIPGAFKKVGLVGAWLQEGIRRASD